MNVSMYYRLKKNHVGIQAGTLSAGACGETLSERCAVGKPLAADGGRRTSELGFAGKNPRVEFKGFFSNGDFPACRNVNAGRFYILFCACLPVHQPLAGR
jgi:hypothetical protein